jgi:hypothetical protein
VATSTIFLISTPIKNEPLTHFHELGLKIKTRHLYIGVTKPISPPMCKSVGSYFFDHGPTKNNKEENMEGEVIVRKLAKLGKT